MVKFVFILQAVSSLSFPSMQDVGRAIGEVLKQQRNGLKIIKQEMHYEMLLLLYYSPLFCVTASSPPSSRNKRLTKGNLGLYKLT